MPHSFDHHLHDDLAAAPGDSRPQAFERLYQDLHARIYNLAARVLGDPDEAADITQDVFLKAFQEMPALPRDADMERWMYRVTVNACYDVLRRRARRATTPLDAVGELPARGDAFERAETTRAVEQALAALNPRYRTALVLKDLHGLGNGEIAEVMGVNLGSAGVLLFRARAAFRRAFGKASPAGAGRAAGMGLAAFLPSLPVPATLQIPPAFLPVPTLAPAFPAPALPAPSHLPGGAPIDGLLPAAAVPAAGVLAKLGAALTTKVALVAIGASAVAGGGIAAQVATHADDSSASVAGPSRTVVPARAAGCETAGSPASTGCDDLTRHRVLHAEALQEQHRGEGADGETHGAGAPAGSGTGTHAGGSGSGGGSETGTHGTETGAGGGSGSGTGDGVHDSGGTGDGTHGDAGSRGTAEGGSD